MRSYTGGQVRSVPGMLTDIDDTPVWVHPADGPVLAGVEEVLAVVGDVLGTAAEWVAVPSDRLPEEFFVLRTRLAGEVVQKFVNYRLKLAVVGPVPAVAAASDAWNDFVREANRGRQLWFVDTLAELADRLARRG